MRSFLLLSNTPHQYKWIDLKLPRSKRGTNFFGASKFGEVPVLINQDQAFCQSNAILIYLAKLTGQFSGVANKQSQAIAEWLYWETNRIGFSIPNLRYALSTEDQPQEVLLYLRSRAICDLRELNNALSAQDFLLSCGPTIADISCSAYLFWLNEIAVNLDDYSYIHSWLGKIAALPNWVHPDDCLLPLIDS
ncbi:MAG: glutathione S-transferase family protein [Pseudomonadales bacterium]|nr:glutathione S-transferase family protein [Pseudomonadales bacterium]